MATAKLNRTSAKRIAEMARTADDPAAEKCRNIAAKLKAASLSHSDKGEIYFIQAASGPIKIGRANSAKRRLAEIQIANFESLVLVASTKGGRKTERSYHTRFAHSCIRGEWFAPHPDILAEIARLTTRQGGE